ncbi:MAG: TM0106 family RecB-like putative nuclease, partial [Chloroflexota bacterium]
DDALKLVAGITRAQRQELRGRGIDSRGSLATATLPLEPPVKTSSLESFSRIKEQARVQVASDALDVPVSELLKPARDELGAMVADRGLSALPMPNPGDLFFDIEGDPFAFWDGLEYLFGIWEPGTGDGLWDSGAYRELWALNRADEKKQFERVMDLFVARLQQYPRMHIYHYAPYEPTALKRLAGRHATREEELDDLLRKRVFVDLYRVVRQGLRAGVESYSIKRLEPLYGYRREIELRDANSSIVEFEQVLEVGDPDGKIKEQIALYNRDDCISTLRLRDWLEERRVEAADTWGELPRPPTEVQPTSEELTARQAEVRALEEKLTAGITNDPTAQSEADRATWLMAHLLDWHRREQKSTFWRFYDLMSKSDDELFEEAEPIGRLEFIEKTDPGGRARSHDYHYRFAPQEHKVDTGLEVHDPQLVEKTKTGTVEAIDKDAGTIVIRRPKDWAGQHPTSIVPLNVFRAKDQQTALMRLGEWVAENGIDSPSDDYRAARDLLLRRPPRAGQSDGQSLVRVAEQESGTAAAQRLALELDGTTLAVQGPPGSGKTYTGAQMILALMGDVVRGGRRVGMTSNSHKVIGNLVEAACDAAEDAEVELRVVQKGKEHEVFTHRFVKGVGDNDDVRSALEADDALVAAGTPWLWADPDLRGSLDTLFVDEAGQVSLANVVAMAGSARNIVLLGDPQQLDQPTQGEHPEGAGVSALGHFLGTEETVSDKRGVFLEKTWRMHPRITGYTSELFYEGRLTTIDGLDRQEVHGDGEFVGSGIRWVPVKHTGNTNESEEEADRVAEIWKSLIGRQWTDREGVTRMIEAKDIVIISPFNAHRLLIQERLPTGARVGTVDKFQGQEAAVSIYTMATSRPEDAPRGIDFLYSLNRLNVATSRARALAIVVASPYLLDMVPHSPKQLSMANGLCAFVEAAPPV